MEPEEAWAAVADERRALADLLDGIDPAAWAAPSRCGGWTVADVLAHLVHLAEGTRRSVMLAGLRAHPWPPFAGGRVARRLAARTSPADLVDRLRRAAGGRFVVPGMPPTVALGEVLVHRPDLADAAGVPARPADLRLRVVLEAELRLWWALGAPRIVRRLRFEPTDAPWVVGPAGGPVVVGPGEALLLAATGRGLDPAVTGAGADALRR